MDFIKRIYTLLLTLALSSVMALAQNKQFLVVLDAGHGGHDAGAVGVPNTNREKDINLDITLKVGKLLEQNCPDVKVLYTRSTDVFVTLGGRADIANKAKADLFVSIHTNAIERSPSRQPMGVQSYTLSLKTAGTNLEVEKRENSVIQFEADGEQKYGFANPNSSESDIMFELMQDRDMQESVNFAKLAQDEMVRSGGRKDMGVLQANLAVLRLTYMPSVLLEVGFISTPAEETFLMSAEGRTIMAQSIYNAIARYKTQHTGRMSNLEKIDYKTVQKQIDERMATQQVEQKTEQTPTVTQPANVSKPRQVQPQPANPVQPANQQTQAQPLNQQNSAVQTEPSKPAKESVPSGPVFMLQLLVASSVLPANSPQLKGLKADYYQEASMFKYTYGATTDYNEILRLKKQLADKFPGSFVIAFRNGQKIQLNEAIQEWKRNNR